MPDRARLLALAEECEAATGPDRELDARIATARYPEIVRDAPEHRAWIKPYTDSLDAAVSLVPAEHDWIIYNVNGYIGGTPYAQVGPSITAFAATPALAVTAAALRVLAEEAT